MAQIDVVVSEKNRPADISNDIFSIQVSFSPPPEVLANEMSFSGNKIKARNSWKMQITLNRPKGLLEENIMLEYGL